MSEQFRFGEDLPAVVLAPAGDDLRDGLERGEPLDAVAPRRPAGRKGPRPVLALVGDTDVTEISATLDSANTATGNTVTTAERTALRAEEIRLIPDGQALVIYRNAPAMLVTLIPWTHRPDGGDIANAITRVRTARTHQP